MIPEEFRISAQHCADNGIPLHSEENTDLQLRTWATELRAGGRDIGFPPHRMATAPTINRPWGSKRPPTPEESKRIKAALKKKRKIQKLNGTR